MSRRLRAKVESSEGEAEFVLQRKPAEERQKPEADSKKVSKSASILEEMARMKAELMALKKEKKKSSRAPVINIHNGQPPKNELSQAEDEGDFGPVTAFCHRVFFLFSRYTYNARRDHRQEAGKNLCESR